VSAIGCRTTVNDTGRDDHDEQHDLADRLPLATAGALAHEPDRVTRRRERREQQQHVATREPTGALESSASTTPRIKMTVNEANPSA
jgi:hypothetical protein